MASAALECRGQGWGAALGTAATLEPKLRFGGCDLKLWVHVTVRMAVHSSPPLLHELQGPTSTPSPDLLLVPERLEVVVVGVQVARPLGDPRPFLVGIQERVEGCLPQHPVLVPAPVSEQVCRVGGEAEGRGRGGADAL